MSVCVIVCVVISSLSGQSEWLAEEMKSEKKIQYMIKHYSDFQKRMKTQGKRENTPSLFLRSRSRLARSSKWMIKEK